MTADMSQSSIKILFEGETDPGKIFRKLDVDGSKSLDFSEIAKSIEGAGMNISSLISGIEPSAVSGVGDFAQTVIGILSSQIEIMKVKRKDHLRTVPLCAGHIGIADLDLEARWFIHTTNEPKIVYFIVHHRLKTRSVLCLGQALSRSEYVCE